MRTVRCLLLSALFLFSLSAFAAGPPVPRVEIVQAKEIYAGIDVSATMVETEKNTVGLTIDLKESETTPKDSILRFRIFSASGECKGTRSFMVPPGVTHINQLKLTKMDPTDVIILVPGSRSVKYEVTALDPAVAGMLAKHKIPVTRYNECTQTCFLFNGECANYCAIEFNCGYCTECTIGEGHVPPCDNLTCACISDGTLSGCPQYCPLY